jgi:hypothetical protein
MLRKATTQKGAGAFEPYFYSIGNYPIELKAVSKPVASVNAGSVAGKAVRGLRVNGHLGSGPSVFPVSDVSV